MHETNFFNYKYSDREGLIMIAEIRLYNSHTIRVYEANSKKRLFNKIRQDGIIRSDFYIVVTDNLIKEYFRMTATGKIYAE